MFPFLQVRQLDFTIAGDKLSCYYPHVRCRSDVADGGSLGVAILDPQAYRDVVGLVLYENGKFFNILRDSERYMFLIRLNWNGYQSQLLLITCNIKVFTFKHDGNSSA